MSTSPQILKSRLVLLKTNHKLHHSFYHQILVLAYLSLRKKDSLTNIFVVVFVNDINTDKRLIV